MNNNNNNGRGTWGKLIRHMMWRGHNFKAYLPTLQQPTTIYPKSWGRLRNQQIMSKIFKSKYNIEDSESNIDIWRLSTSLFSLPPQVIISTTFKICTIFFPCCKQFSPNVIFEWKAPLSLDFESVLSQIYIVSLPFCFLTLQASRIVPWIWILSLLI